MTETIPPSLPKPGGSTDRPGRVERRGIEAIPASERHGHPRELFSLWAGANVAYLYLLFGGTMILLGMRLWQAILVIVVGNLAWVMVGIVSTSGPSAGAPGTIVTRAMYGVRGNRVLSAGLTWFTSVCFEAINLSIGTLAGVAFIAYIGIGGSTLVKAIVLVAVAAATFSLSILGHATIVRCNRIFTVLLGACMLGLAGFTVAHADFGYVPSSPLHGSAALAAMLVGLTIILSGPLSWPTGADYSRYLPSDTSPKAVAMWVTLGGFVPATLLAVVGALAGTVIDMSDPQISMDAILPGWFYAIFLLLIVAGSITNNVLTSYSSGLALQAAGVRARRSLTVLIDAAIGGAMTAYALFISDFLTTLNEFLQLAIVWIGPGLAIYVVDVIIRRSRYDADGLQREDRGSPFWYSDGLNWDGVIAFFAGAVVAFLCANTTHWEGPIARALNGADLSGLLGPLVAAAVYLGATTRRRRVTTGRLLAQEA